MKPHYFKGIELTLVTSDEGVNVSKYKYEILPEARKQLIPAAAILIPPCSSISNCQSFLPLEKTVIHNENGTVGNETLRTRRDVYYIDAIALMPLYWWTNVAKQR